MEGGLHKEQSRRSCPIWCVTKFVSHQMKMKMKWKSILVTGQTLSVEGPDKWLQNEQILSVDFLNGLYLSKYLLSILKILDLGGY